MSCRSIGDCRGAIWRHLLNESLREKGRFRDTRAMSLFLQHIKRRSENDSEKGGQLKYTTKYRQCPVHCSRFPPCRCSFPAASQQLPPMSAFESGSFTCPSSTSGREYHRCHVSGLLSLARVTPELRRDSKSRNSEECPMQIDILNRDSCLLLRRRGIQHHPLLNPT